MKLDRGDDLPYTVRRRIPFSASIPWESEPMTGGTAAAWASVSSLEVSPSENEIAVDLSLDLSAEVTCPSEEQIMTDLFSVKEPFSVKTEKIPLTSAWGTGSPIRTDTFA